MDIVSREIRSRMVSNLRGKDTKTNWCAESHTVSAEVHVHSLLSLQMRPQWFT